MCSVPPAFQFSPTHYCSSPVDTQPPEYNPPEYGHGSVYGISLQVDEWIVGKTPLSYLDSCEKLCRHASTAERHKSKILPLLSTHMAVRNALATHQSLHTVKFISLPTAIIYGFVKPSYHFARMAVAVSQTKWERLKVEDKILAEILQSLTLSLEAVLQMVVRLGLETCAVVKQQCHSKYVYHYLTLARILEGYGSRFAPPETIYLASKKTVPKSHCSGVARLHLDQIHNLKTNLLRLNLIPAQDLSNSATEIERWMRKVLPALKNLSADRGEDDRIPDILQRLCSIRDELVGLVLM